MSIIGNNIIVINRGDTYEFDLSINDEAAEDGKYRLSGKDALYFGLMDPHQPFEQALVKKKYTSANQDEITGTIAAVLEAEDTLDLIPGKYYYAVKLHMQHYDNLLEKNVDKVVTVIDKTKFIICD